MIAKSPMLRTALATAAFSLSALGALAETVTPTGAERKAILDAIRAPIAQDLGQPVEFVVKRIAVTAPWAFVMADVQGPGGTAIEWEKTVCSGDVSHLTGALLKKSDEGAWNVEELVLCPTDVAWATWAEDHQAPAELFGLE
jgi:hypothetical protein